MIAIIGDIHGMYRDFIILVNKIIKKYSIDKIILIGDLIDRGPKSKEVIEFALDLSNSYKLIFLLGNHEDMMIDYIFEQNRYDRNLWFENGGYSTVKSFSETLYNNVYFNWENISEELKALCENELNFLLNAKLYHEEKFDNNIFFFSHAGIEFPHISPYNQMEAVSNEFDKNIKHPYIWARVVDSFTDKIDNFVFVHGHTPVFYLGKGIFGEPYINKNSKDEIISINIDTGCVYGGNLTAMIIDDNGNFSFEIE